MSARLAARKPKAKGETMPGTDKFPIRNASDLSDAKHDVGRASNPATARRWINKRAKDLGEPGLGESREGSKRKMPYTHSRASR